MFRGKNLKRKVGGGSLGKNRKETSNRGFPEKKVEQQGGGDTREGTKNESFWWFGQAISKSKRNHKNPGSLAVFGGSKPAWRTRGGGGELRVGSADRKRGRGV